MGIQTFFKFLTSASTRRQPIRRRPAASRLRVEALEDRCLLSNYALTLLDTPADSVSSEAHDLNASGQLVGTAWIGRYENWKPEGDRALLWNNDGVMIDLGTLGGQYSSARAINDLGQIVGWTTRPDNSGHGFLVNPEDTDGNGTPDRWFRDFNGDGANDLMVELPMSAAADINNIGQVVGGSSLWTPATPNGSTGALTDLGLSATAINDAGHVVGSASIAGTTHAVLWQNGVMTDLGEGGASDINASGQVTGYLPQPHWYPVGFRWTPTAPNGTVGAFTVLPPSDAYYYAHGSGLNNAGHVVGNSGYSEPEGGAEQHATVWVGGTPQNLGYVPRTWTSLQHAEAINDAGQIVGRTGGSDAFVNQPPYQAFLLTPVDGPSITVNDVTVTEGNTGTRTATFTVTLSAAYGQPVTVAYATANGTATAGSDYQAVSGTLTIPAGQTTGTITVLVSGDRLGEANETFFVNLSSPTNATIADGQGVGTIVDDEPRISISDVTKAEGKKGQTTLFTFTVTLSAAYDQAVTMSFRTVNGTATTGDGDYIAKTGTLTFAPGEMTKTITIEVKGDSKREANETFYLDLFGNSSNSSLTKNRGLGTILNDD